MLLYLIVCIFAKRHIVATLYFVLFVTFYNTVFDKQCKQIMFCIGAFFYIGSSDKLGQPLVCTLLYGFAQIFL